MTATTGGPPPENVAAAAAAVAAKIEKNCAGTDTSQACTSTTTATTPTAPKKPVRRIVRRKRNNRNKKNGTNGEESIIDPVLYHKVLSESNLPTAYSFEIIKSVTRIVQLLELKAQQPRTQQQQQPSLNTTTTTKTSTAAGVTIHVALQMPEGLLLYATVLSDVLQRLVAATYHRSTSHRKSSSSSQAIDTTTKTTTRTLSPPAVAASPAPAQPPHPLVTISVLGDVTYGACCVDDLGAQALGCELLIHYGHSCLVPIQHTVLPCLYVFVEITIDVPHCVDCFHQTMLQRQQERTTTTNTQKPQVYLLGTIQFRHALMEARRLLRDPDTYNYEVSIPQAKPLSPGEVLGCTSPVLTTGTAATSAVVLFIADGRFHLESTMISNPHIDTFYRYDPYPKALTEETYNHVHMKSIRYAAIVQARTQMRRSTTMLSATETTTKQQQQPTKKKTACVFGIILGTLGRQGNPALLTKIQMEIAKRNTRQTDDNEDKHWPLKSFVMLASEITPSKLLLFAQKVHVWVQIACPRLSVDWGQHLSGRSDVPVLNPYELFVCLDLVQWRGRIPQPYNAKPVDDDAAVAATEGPDDQSYPMDYYSQEGGPWSNYHDRENKGRKYTIQAPQPPPNTTVAA